MALCEIESMPLWLTKHQKLILYDLAVMIFSTYALYRRLFISQEANLLPHYTLNIMPKDVEYITHVR
jgi:hypothetical protein